VLLVALLLQIQAVDSVYSTPALRAFVDQAAIANRNPPPALAGYRASVESELALILRDSLGRELVGQIEQLAARADWERASGKYDLHVVGFRAQSLGAPYSALTWTRMYTVPTLYGNRLVVGINDGVPRTKRDSTYVAKARKRDSLQGREQFRAPHPLAVDRERFYRFTGGDTVTTMYSGDRAIRLLRVHVEPVMHPKANFIAYSGELDFDADRHQLVRMRGRLVNMTTQKDPLIVRRTGAVVVAYVEFENAEVNGQVWLPAYQRTEVQAQMGLLGDTRPVYRIVSRFRNYTLLTDTVVAVAQMDTLMPRTRATLTFASKDSVSRFGAWEDNLGVSSGRVTSDDFDDIAPDIWKPTGKPRVDYWPRRLEDVARYNRVEGMFTGVAGAVRFRDLVPGLSARGTIGWAWSEQTARGMGSIQLVRANWIHGARAERALASTNDFMLALESGLSIGPLLSGVDDADYVDRWTAALTSTRILGHVDRALLTGELAVVQDRVVRAHVANAFVYGGAFRPNRNAAPGRYARATARLQFHPRVTGETLSPGFGANLLYELATGELDWQRVETRLALRNYWRGFVLSSRVNAGAVFGANLPPQTLYEMGGYADLPSYGYKEFGGDRAALGAGQIAYQFPILRTPRRVRVFVIPGLSPGIAGGVQGGWASASSDAARRALLALGGDGITPLSRPTDRVRATATFRITILSGAMGAGFARTIDHAERWKPFFVWGASF
jgi:hypothetical protein